MEARIERVASPGDTDAPESNAWIVGDDDEVIVVDPGRDADAVLSAIGDRDILAVICTHGHAAHVAAAPAVAASDEAPVALHPRDRLLWREAHPDGDPEIDMEDGGIFEVADVSLEVIHAPGHSPGSVCLYSEELEAVFAGDGVTARGPVRHDGEYTDFPAQLSAIGEHLLTLPGPTRVLPGHGEETTVSAIGKRFDSWVNAGPLSLSTDPD
jgi:glyoxylase-like metal-dependent hydrolase (beta-lactamase superfamily II)